MKIIFEMIAKQNTKSRNFRINPSRSELSTLMALLKAQRARFFGAFACMIISAGATALYAYLLGPMLRCLFLGEPAETIGVSALQQAGSLTDLTALMKRAGPMAIGLIIVSVAVVKALAFFGQNALSGLAGSHLLHRLRKQLFQNLLEMNPFSAKSLTSGDLVARFTADAEHVEGAVTQGLVAYVKHGAEVVALASLALVLDPVLGLMGFVVFPPAAAVILKLGKRLKRQRFEMHEAVGRLGEAIDETWNGLPVIRAYGAHQTAEGRFEAHSRRIRQTRINAMLLRAMSSPFNEILGASALSATLVYAAHRIAAGTLSAEAFISFFSALFLLYQPIKGFGRAHHAVQAGRAALARLAQLRADESSERPPLSPQGPGGGCQNGSGLEGTTFPSPPQRGTDPPHTKSDRVLRSFTHRIELADVSTAYRNSYMILKHINMTLHPGDTIAVIGPSGSGKSTLLNLLEGLLPPTRGRISVDDIIVHPDHLRGLFAPVRQEPFLFNDTIRMNVGVGCPDAPDHEVEAICEAAGVSAFARSLEGGLDALVGPGGSALSVGQQQRVCLARALISKAPVLLLDEVTASLDGETEQSLVAGLDPRLADRTVVIVTHRLSTAKWAKRLILVEDGGIRADGLSHELIRTHPRVKAVFGDQLSTK